MKRIVVTGFGLVTPLGFDVKTTWSNIIAGKSGISKIENFDSSDLSVHIAGEIKQRKDGAEDSPHYFNAANYIEAKDIKKMDKFMHYAMAATEEALNMANWHPADEESLSRTGVTIGSGIGGLSVIEETVLKMAEKGSSRVSPFFIPASLINLATGHVSIKYGFLGPNHATVTACATGAHAIYNAAQMILCDDADVMICGGAESAICKTGVAGFAAAKALSTKFNENPTQASRPWDEGRDGFVMGEGSGVLVLEEYEHAKRRGATILAEFAGAGVSSDAYHMTAPHPEGKGAKNAMIMAMKKAAVSYDKIGYINAHGTSTPLGDMAELNSVQELFLPYSNGKKILMSSTKSSIGHTLGAAGAIEAIFSILALRDSILPPTLNLENPSTGTENFDLIPLKAKEAKNLEYVLSNSFGFGGTNASVIFKKFV